MMVEPLQEAKDLWETLETDDVGQKRYMMYHIFDLLIETVYSKNGRELPDETSRVEELKNSEGYIYKLSQDFLTSSSTFEKKKKLEKMRDYID